MSYDSTHIENMVLRKFVFKGATTVLVYLGKIDNIDHEAVVKVRMIIEKEAMDNGVNQKNVQVADQCNLKPSSVTT